MVQPHPLGGQRLPDQNGDLRGGVPLASSRKGGRDVLRALREAPPRYRRWHDRTRSEPGLYGPDGCRAPDPGRIEDRMSEPKAASDKLREEIEAKRRAYAKEREAAMAEARKEAEKRFEIMQQRRLAYEKERTMRRQAYEKELAERRQQYEAMRKAQLKKQTQARNSQDTEFDRLDKSRMDLRQKIEQKQKQIDALEDEIRQLIFEAREQPSRNMAMPPRQPR